jgi:hypothetical protein
MLTAVLQPWLRTARRKARLRAASAFFLRLTLGFS